MDHPEVTLGDKAIAVYPQRHAYLTNRLGKFVDQIAAGDVGGVSDVVSLLGDSAYDVLSALIPTLGKRMPKYEFAGYGSQESYDAKDYDPELDKSPTFPEIVDAFEMAIRVNRFDVFKALGSLVDPKMLKADLSLWISEQISTGSLNSPSTSGGSTPDGSGTTLPTSEASATAQPLDSESPTPISNGSHQLISA